MNEPIIPQIQPITNLNVKDLTGRQFGRLFVIGYVGSSDHKQSRWLCKCDCGNHVTLCISSLSPKRPTLSCGCLANELSSLRKRKHGASKISPEYRAWKSMRVRCNNPNFVQYSDYGGRGIRVCERWNNFANFLEDMGHKPSPQHSLDRINVNGNYEPSNCRWATQKEQVNNARSNILLTYNGKTQNLTQWAGEVGIRWATIYARINKLGWNIEKSLTEPTRQRSSKK